MTNAEYNRLDQSRPTRTARNRLKLLLKIAAKSELLTKSCGQGNGYPRTALESPSGKKSLQP
jgi:hypothetical protein